MDRDSLAYLWDVQQAANAIEEFAAGMDAVGYAQTFARHGHRHISPPLHRWTACTAIVPPSQDIDELVESAWGTLPPRPWLPRPRDKRIAFLRVDDVFDGIIWRL